MKITKKYLQKVIKEEAEKAVKERIAEVMPQEDPIMRDDTEQRRIRMEVSRFLHENRRNIEKNRKAIEALAAAVKRAQPTLDSLDF